MHLPLRGCGLGRAFLAGLAVACVAGLAPGAGGRAFADDAPPAAATAPVDVDALVRALGSDSFSEREAATERLKALGPKAQPALKAALASQDAEVRYRVRLLLGATGRKVRELVDLLRGASDPRRNAFFEELIALGDNAVEPLLEVLERSFPTSGTVNPADARVAFFALEELKRPAAVERLVGLISRPIHGWQQQLARTLGKCDAREALRLLGERIGARETSPESVRLCAVQVIAYLPQQTGDNELWLPIVAVLRDGLSDPQAGVRREILNVLRLTRGKPAQDAAREAVLLAVEDRDDSVRLAAVQRLVQLKEPRVLPYLRRALAAEDPKLVIEATQGLGQLGDRSAVADLLVLIDRPEDAVKGAAVDALRLLRARPAVPRLVELIESPDVNPQVQAKAIQALGEIGDRAAFAALASYHERARACPPPERDAKKLLYGRLAVQAIAQIEGDEATAFVVDLVRTASDDEIKEALLAAERRPAAQVGPAVAGLLERRWLWIRTTTGVGPHVRPYVALTLGKLRYRPAVPALIAFLDDANEATRQSAIQALGEIGDARGVEALKAAKARRPELQTMVDDALVRLGDREILDPKIARASEECDKFPRDTSRRNNLGILYLYAREYAKAKAEFAKILEQEPANEVAAYNLACTASLSARADEAIEWLRKSVELGFDDWRHMERDSDLDPIRHLDDYKELIRELKGGGTGEGRRPPEPPFGFEGFGEDGPRPAIGGVMEGGAIIIEGGEMMVDPEELRRVLIDEELRRVIDEGGGRLRIRVVDRVEVAPVPEPAPEEAPPPKLFDEDLPPPAGRPPAERPFWWEGAAAEPEMRPLEGAVRIVGDDGQERIFVVDDEGVIRLVPAEPARVAPVRVEPARVAPVPVKRAPAPVPVPVPGGGGE